MTIRGDYLARHHRPLFAAWAYAKDLTREGFEAPAAALAASEVFPEVPVPEILSRLNWNEEDGFELSRDPKGGEA